MAYKMSVSGNYGTHLGALIKAVNITSGDVLELGIGIFSTPYLHYQCLVSKRNLVSYDNDASWVKKFAAHPFYHHMYEDPYHKFVAVSNWDDADIEKPWDVALVDHNPSERRIVEIRRLADHAKFIVIHDSNEEQERTFHYSEIYPLFKYKKVWDKDDNHATLLSNFVDLADFWE